MDQFLPTDYEVPQGKGNYMKFEEGENRFRILTSPILGYEYWNEDNKGNRKPIRKRMNEDLIIKDIQEPDKIKHFWAMVVWNYQDKKIQILEITQKGLQKSLRSLAKDEDWGSPVNKYDIVVSKEGEKMETRYTLQPKPAKATEKEITEAFEKTSVNLEALYTGDDPFMSEDVNPEDVKV